MRCKIVAVIAFVLGALPVVAQPDSTSSPAAYFGILNSGALFGKDGNGSSFSVFTIHGVRYKRFGLGVGLGYDAYRDWNVVPFFASLVYDLVSGARGALYLQMNSGYSKAWTTVAGNSPTVYTAEGGYFYHPVIGYRITRDRLTVYLGAGYKFQRLTYEEAPRSWIWGYPSTKVSVHRDMERLSMHLGIGL